MARNKDRLIVNNGLSHWSLESAPFFRSSSGPVDERPGQSPGLDSGVSKAGKHTEADGESS